MAARSKKKDSTPLVDVSNNTVMEGLVTAETVQEQFIINDGELIMDSMDGLPESVDHPEYLQADNSEVDMSANADLPESQSFDGTVTKETAEPVINLDPTLSIQNVVKLYDRLKRSYATYDAIEIDASHVTSIDTATLQLFVALKKDAIKQKKDVVFFQPSPRFIESARLLDLLDILEITHI